MWTNEEEYLCDLKTRWRANWPGDMPIAPEYPHGHIPVSSYLRCWGRQIPDKTAYIYYGREVSYKALDQLSENFAAFLLRSGVRPGDRVAVYLPNCMQFVIAFFGILKASCVYVPVSPQLREEDLGYQLEDSDPSVVVCADWLLDTVVRVRARTNIKLVVSARPSDYLPDKPEIPVPDDLAGESRTAAREAAECLEIIEWAESVSVPGPLPAEPSLDSLAALNYTGGTTGLPKGCEHTHGDLLYTAATSSTYRFIGGGDQTGLVFIPISWIAGENAGLIVPVFSGATCVLLSRWDAESAMVAISRYHVTAMLASLDAYVQIMEHPHVKNYNLSSLTTPLAMSLIRKLNSEYRQRWMSIAGPGSVLREGAYGMTETHTSDTITAGFQTNNRDLVGRPVFCGIPMPGTEFKIVDFNTRALCDINAEGEIAIRTPSLFRGYWRKPAATQEAFQDGWFYTGDIGVLDEDGILHFLGRRKEMLKVNGVSVFPSEIEIMVSRIPGVAGCAVVGRPDERVGERPVAFVELEPSAVGHITAPDIEAWCRSKMARFKLPEVQIIGQLPKSANGKVLKDALKERNGV